MPCPHKKDNPTHKKHTPIVSEKQQGLFGAEYARRKEGKEGRMPGITEKELRSHLKESKGKKLKHGSAPFGSFMEKRMKL